MDLGLARRTVDRPTKSWPCCQSGMRAKGSGGAFCVLSPDDLRPTVTLNGNPKLGRSDG